MKTIYIILICILMPSLVSAEMYECVDNNGVRHFSDRPPATIEEDVTVREQIKTSAAQPKDRQQEADDQTSDTSSASDTNFTDRYKRARLKAEIEKAEKLVETLTQKTEDIAAKLKRAKKKRIFYLYRKYDDEHKKLHNAEMQLERIKRELQRISPP